MCTFSICLWLWPLLIAGPPCVCVCSLGLLTAPTDFGFLRFDVDNLVNRVCLSLSELWTWFMMPAGISPWMVMCGGSCPSRISLAMLLTSTIVCVCSRCATFFLLLCCQGRATFKFWPPWHIGTITAAPPWYFTCSWASGQQNCTFRTDFVSF